ncbi:MAG: hypothetical protein WKH64_07820 [Chloroflexia bacterium]
MAENIKKCAMCGQEVNIERFCITERWTPKDVDEYRTLTDRLAHGEEDEEGGYVFYFCRWRHLGDFMSEAGMELQARNLRDEFRSL